MVWKFVHIADKAVLAVDLKGLRILLRNGSFEKVRFGYQEEDFFGGAYAYSCKCNNRSNSRRFERNDLFTRDLSIVSDH